MKKNCRLWLFGLFLALSLAPANTGIADDAVQAMFISRASDANTACRGSMYGSRWCDRGDGTVKDMTTGLVWIKSTDCWDRLRWYEILAKPFKRLRNGTCGLEDGSAWGDWRAPTRKELVALTRGPAPVRYKSPGPFTGLQSGYYWTTTTKADERDYAWSLNMRSGLAVSSPKHMLYYLWPVRNDH